MSTLAKSIKITEEHQASIRKQYFQPLDGTTLFSRKRFYVFSPSKGREQALYIVHSYDHIMGVGICESERTGARYVFAVLGEAKPARSRPNHPYLKLALFEVNTVVLDTEVEGRDGKNIKSSIWPEIGERVKGLWLAPATYAAIDGGLAKPRNSVIKDLRYP